MAIDKSIISDVIFLGILCSTILRIKKQYKDIKIVLFYFILITAAYSAICCCIFPIQYTRNEGEKFVFNYQFSYMTVYIWKKYFLFYAIEHIQFFMSFFLLALSLELIFERCRRIIYAIMLSFIFPLVHLFYNMFENYIVNDIVKIINLEDCLLIFLGFWTGWIIAKVEIKINPDIIVFYERRRTRK